MWISPGFQRAARIDLVVGDMKRNGRRAVGRDEEEALGANEVRKL